MTTNGPLALAVLGSLGERLPARPIVFGSIVSGALAAVRCPVWMWPLLPPC